MDALQQLLARYRDIDAIKSAISLLSWDRQVLMPPGGGEARTAHIGALTRMAHELLVSDETVALMEKASEQAFDEDSRSIVRAFRRDYDMVAKLPVALVEEKSKVSSDGYDAWKRAKADSNFALLRPFLERLFEIAGETAEALGYVEQIYDPLIDLFEEGATYADARAMFDGLAPAVKKLVAEIQERQPIDDAFLKQDWDREKLRDFAEETQRAIGFDLDRGRLDLCPNAFCTHMATDDVRMTTRHSESLTGVLFSSLHEMGHGLYEQNSPPEWDRTPLAGGISLGVHESQSRLWENIVGRSLPFWRHFYPSLQARFPALGGVDVERFYAAINSVKPSLIRIGSDELTYNLHILIRFELEAEILTGKVAVKDLPEAWNEKMRTNLGIVPPNDARGVLQDVHWSRGSVGYFPTYTMGNLIGWQMWDSLQRDLGDTDALMQEGSFAPILGWLREKVYLQGRRYRPRDLVERVTGAPMGAEAFLGGMRRKFEGIYASAGAATSA